MAYRIIRDHENAIDFFKVQMSLAWELEDNRAEIRSYDNLSQEYYYLGNIEKARLYHERVFRGKVEPNAEASVSKVKNFKNITAITESTESIPDTRLSSNSKRQFDDNALLR